jgi:hypothetical protein
VNWYFAPGHQAGVDRGDAEGEPHPPELIPINENTRGLFCLGCRS